MACRYTYQGKTYEAHEFDDVLRAMPPSVASKYMSGVESIPSAPMIGDTKAWVALGLKKAVMYAVQNGISRVAWANGEQNAAHYDLAKQVDAIKATRQGDQFTIAMKRKGQRYSFDHNEMWKGKTDELPGVVGKELAEKVAEIPDQSTREFSGLDLKVGGEGMEKFYNEIVPQVANDVLKKLGGGKVETIKIGGVNKQILDEISQQQYESEFDDISDRAQNQVRYLAEEKSKKDQLLQMGFTITPDMLAKVSDGVPMFSRPRNGRFEKTGFRAEIDTRPSPEVVRDVEFLRARLEATGRSSGIPTVSATFAPAQVPDAARGMVSVVKRMFNVDVRFVRTEGLDPRLDFNGIYVGKNVIYVDGSSTDPFSQVIGHEFLHYLKHAAPELYQQFVDEIPRLVHIGKMNAASSTEADAYIDTVKDAAERRELGYEEVRADFFGDSWSDPKFWEALAAANPSVAKKALNALRLFIARIKAMLAGEKSTPLRESLYRDFNAVRDLVLDASQKFAEGGYAPYTGLATTRFMAATKDSSKKLLAPNGKPSNLTERQHAHVRTAEFKAWFGDWEKHANAENPVASLWGDDTVSKVVDENGEPLVVYHGSEKGGFTVMRPDKGDKHRSDMTFAAATRDTARTYSGYGQEITLQSSGYSQRELEDLGYSFDEMEDGVFELYNPDGDRLGEGMTEREAVDEASRWEGEFTTQTESGIYSLFLNIRNPNESSFEGANWDGQQGSDRYSVYDENDEIQYDADGVGVVSEEDANTFANWLSEEGKTYEVRPAEDRYETTNTVGEDAKTNGQDGAIIRQVVDDGGKSGVADAEADDVFIFFKSNQAKSATQNTGAYSKSNDDLRFNQANSGRITPADKAIYGMASEGKNAVEILKFIAATSRNPFYKQVAKLLLKTGINPTVTVGDSKGWKFNAGEGKYAAAYNPTTDTVALFRPAASERNMLHELMHAASINALGKNGLAAMQMKALYAFVKKSGKLHGMYGMADVDEFMSEAFSNPKFQAALKKVMAPNQGGGVKTGWDWFVRTVRNILGLPVDSHDALSKALEIGVWVMRENVSLKNSESGLKYNHGLPERTPANRTLDGAELSALRRSAADLERTEKGIFLRVEADGRAIATGPKGTRIPETFRRFANDNGLAFFAERRIPKAPAANERAMASNVPGDVTTNSQPMPIAYRESGAHYFGEDKGEALDRTDRTRFNVIDDAWQASKAKYSSLINPDSINTLIYNFQNKFIDLDNKIEQIKADGGTVSDLNDAALGETLFHGKVMVKTSDFLKDEIKPLLKQLKTANIKMEDLEQFLHARHAPEANKVLAGRNPNQQMIDAGRAKADADLKALQVQLQHAKAQGSSVVALEASVKQATAERAQWHGAQAFKGTEDERNSLSGMTDAAAAQVMAGLPGLKRTIMNNLAAKVDAIQAKTLDELQKYGLMDRASLDAWRTTYRHYIPLHRDEAHPDSMSHPIGQGFSVKGDASKKRTGSNSEVTNILGHIAMQRETAITRGEKNSVAKRLYILAAQNPDADFWSVDKLPMLKTIDPRTGFVHSQIDPTYKNKPNVLMLRIAGKDAAIVFTEQNPEAVRLAGALKNLDGQDLDIVERTIGKATRWFSAINTQYNPIFGIINLMRDAQAGVLNLTSTEIGDKKAAVAKNIPASLRAIWRAEQWQSVKDPAMTALWEEFKAIGGQTGYRDVYSNPEDRVDALKKELGALDRGKVSEKLHAVADWLSNYNTAMENAVRLSTYKAGIDSGMTKERAASLAKNITVNFNRKGAKAAKLGAFYAFFNASVQGTTRLAQTMKGPAGKKILIGGIGLGVLQQVLGAMFMGGDDDDEWDKIPQFIKERSMVFPISHDQYVAIPMPLGFNVLPNIGRLFTEWAMGGNDKPTGKQLGKLMNVVIGSFNPIGGTDVVDAVSPTVADPVISLLRNKAWTGKPIYREDMASLNPTPGFTRSKDSATPWAKGSSYVINLATGGTDYQHGAWSPTPDQIDYVIGQLTGGTGREIGKLSQVVSAPFTGDELPAYKIPLVGRLYGTTEGPSGQSEKFYANIKELNGIEREVKGRAKNNGDLAGYRAEEPRVSLIAYGNFAEKQVQKLREQRRMMTKAGNLDGAKAKDDQIAMVMKGVNTKMAAAMQ
ncbi:LPD38 domain-containing protein [Propionivibrio sp.]|uniref:LPD38 domain-containing protein n=1 Tax=Propionivibrio sp. TaxID=2212460 RepID=UPI003BF17E47